MAEVIRMPRMSDTMEEGVLIAWHKKVGDAVKAGDVLAEVETDKATMDLESFQEGTLLHLGVKEGDSVQLKCIAKANPKVQGITWEYQVGLIEAEIINFTSFVFRNAWLSRHEIMQGRLAGRQLLEWSI